MKKHRWLYSAFLIALPLHLQAEECSCKQGSYTGYINVFFQIPSGIEAQIETENLILQSVNWDHYQDYLQLFSDPAAVEKYADGIPWTLDEIHERMNIWIDRWNNQDPFSAFAIYLKNADNRSFVGHIVLGHSAFEGQSELAFLFKPEFLPFGYAKEAVSAILYGYAPRLIRDQYFVNIGSEYCAAAPLNIVHATARVDNPYHDQALRKAGLRHGETVVLWGASRSHYTIDAETLLNHQ